MTTVKTPRSSLGIIIFMTAAVLCAALAGLLLSHVMQQRYPGEPLRPVVVAAGEIVAGRPLTRQDLRVALWPRSSVPQGSHTSVAKLIATRSVPFSSLVRGEPVLARHLSRPHAGIGVAAKLEPGRRAMAIRTESPVALARLIYPGARVDLLTTLRRPGETWGAGRVKTKVILQDLAVLAVGAEIDALGGRQARRESGSALSSRSGDQQRNAARSIVTVEVTPAQSERLALAAREGKIDFVLRSPRDRKKVETEGATSALVLGEGPPTPPAAVAQPPPPPRRRARRRRPSRRLLRRTMTSQVQKPAGPEIYRVGVRN